MMRVGLCNVVLSFAIALLLSLDVWHAAADALISSHRHYGGGICGWHTF